LSVEFPLNVKHEPEIQLLLQAFWSVIDGRASVYVSAPFTSGKRFSEWCRTWAGTLDRSSQEYRAAHRREVIEPNKEHAHAIVRQLRARFRKPVIDPTALPDIPGWTQGDYHSFWARFIESYADTVVFLDGWQYSNGCSYEFLTADRCKATLLDERCRPLGREETIRLIHQAIDELEKASTDTGFLRWVVEQLSHQADQPGREAAAAHQIERR
jgi:hypothetical protein